MPLTIPAADFTVELAPAAANTAIKAAGGAPVMGGSGALFTVPPAAIEDLPGFNVRVDTPAYLEKVAALKASIKAEGFYRDKPVTVYIDKDGDASHIYLTDGYTRMRAVRELIADGVEIANVPVIVKVTGTSLEDLTVALVQGNEGNPLTVYEKSIVVKRLDGMGVEKPRIAERLGVTERYVGDLLVLAGASNKVRNQVIAGKISPTEAIKQLRADPKKAAEKIEAGVKQAEAKGKAKATAKDVGGKKAAAPADPTPAPSKKRETGVEVSVTSRGGKVYTTLSYYFKQGDMVEKDLILPVRLFNDAEWWNWNDDQKTHAFIETTTEIEVRIVQDEPAVEGEEGEEGAEATSGEQAAITDQSGGGEAGEGAEHDDTFDVPETDPPAGEGEDEI